MEKVVLVNPQDEVLGQMEKMQAHENGLLHRAFSVFLFNEKGEMLLQKRAEEKYHSPNQWTNACCSHPRLDESYLDAAKRRIKDVEFMEISEWFQFSGIAVTERRCPQKIKSVVALRPMQGERKTPARKLVLGVV